LIISPDALYPIVISMEASKPVQHAARQLQHFVDEICGVTLLIVDDSAPLAEPAILVGDSAHLRRSCPSLEQNVFGAEEFVLRTVNESLVIAGGEPRGTLYAVYAFLRDHLGCRWFTKELSYIPKQDRIVIPPLDETYSPALTYRNLVDNDLMSPDWCARNHVNGFSSEADLGRGGKISHWQFGHSFDSLIPPDRYFDSHPEYFAVVNGRRPRDEAQLCCTNPEVIRVLTENLRRQIEVDLQRERNEPDNPSPEIYYLAQNDWGNCCECAACRSLIEKECSHTAPLIHLCNNVVEVLDPDYPEKSFLTISYRYSARPPKSLKAHPKLIVQVCPIECCVAHPHATCDFPENVNFREYMKGWQHIAERLWVWDYATHLRNPLLPTPGLHALGENIRWFVEQGVTGMFFQDVGHRQFNSLRGYIIARLMWNPNDDIESLTCEFLEAFYGQAKGPFLDYMDLIWRKVEQENIHVFYSDTPSPAYLSDDILSQAQSLWDEAEASVADEPVFHRRVLEERKHTKFARVERESRKTAAFHCRLEDGQHRMDKPEGLKQDSREILDWAKKRGFGKLGLLSFEQFEHLIESEIVTVENDSLRITFAPRLGPRLLNLELCSEGDECRSLFVTHDSDHPDFPGDVGYHERWLAARHEPDLFGTSTAGWATAGTGLGSYAYFVKPMYHWWHANLAESGPCLTISTRVLNRSNAEADAAIECTWPLSLGPLEDIQLHVLQSSRQLALTEPIQISADEAAPGILLNNEAAKLEVRIRSESEVLDTISIRPMKDQDGIKVSLRTKSEFIIPAASRTFVQSLEVL